MPKTFQISCKKANFRIDGEMLTITANQTFLKSHSLDEAGEYRVKTDYFPYPEVAQVASFIKKFGYAPTKESIDGIDSYTINAKGDEHLMILVTVGILHELITKEEGLCLHEQFILHKANASNVDNYCNFFTDKSEDSDSFTQIKVAGLS